MANDKDFRIKNGLQLGGEFVDNIGTVTGNATLDLSTGNVFSVTPTADVTFTFSNAPASGTAFDFGLSVTGVLIDNSYDLANASYDSVSFSVASQDSGPEGLFFKPDGTKMYVTGGVDDDINEYTLSTAWDITSASYAQNFSVSAQISQPQNVFFKSDGTKMYVIDNGSDDVNEYSLSSAWDISTASYAQNFSVATQETSPQGLFFKSDGTKMYVVGASGDDVNEYSLSSAWDISTASYAQNFSVAAQETNPQTIFFKPDGTKMYIAGWVGGDVNEYTLSSAWDVSTASYVQNFSVSAQNGFPAGISFKSDGTKMYIVSANSALVYQYSTGTAPADATFTYPASVDWPSGTPPTGPADGETDILTFSTTDGGTTWYGVKVGDDMS